MQFTVKSGSLEKQRSACLVVGVFEGAQLSGAAETLDAMTDGALTTVLGSGDLKAKPGQTLLLHRLGGLGFERVLLVGCGPSDEMNDATYRKVLKGASDALKAVNAKDALFTLSQLEVPGRDLVWKARNAVQAVNAALYRYEHTKSETPPDEKPALRKLTFLTATRKETDAANKGVLQGNGIAQGVELARELANLPGNVCTPSYLANQARALARQYKAVTASVMDERDMKQLGMGSLLSVSRGSVEPAKLITLEYKGVSGRKKSKPVVLVGKGLTFDAGGISLKPAAAMDEMKYDMCGAASVIGTIKAAAEMGLPMNIVGVVPSSENLPSGSANKPGDVVTSMSGQTIEILNTDAEGRLILCDALTYSKKFDPEVVIDIATLTGACVIALGKHASGLLSNDDELAIDLLKAGAASGDKAWQLPLWDEYQEQLKSNFADMANIGGREGGTITAACFLSRFTKNYKWAHLDIAGTAWVSGADKGATGRPVPLLTQYLLDRLEA